MENLERFKFQQLDAYKVAREIAVTLCEGLPNEMPGLRRRYFTQSRNSVCELAGAVDLSAAIGAMDKSQAEAVLALALRLKRMLRALTGPTNGPP
jgi:hypothetical protein